MKFKEFDKKDWIKFSLILAIFIIALLASAVFLIVKYLYIWIIFVAVMIVSLVVWSVKTIVYKCARCKNIFHPSMFDYIISPHGFSYNKRLQAWRYLKCPKCRKRSKAIAGRSK